LPARTRATWPESDLNSAVGRTIVQRRPLARSSASKASLACWNASLGFWTQIADSSTICAAPACRAASSRWLCARCSTAHASSGAPLRVARHETTASTRRPRSAAASEPGRVRSASIASVPRGKAALAPPPGRSTHATAWPRSSNPDRVARPTVPVAPASRTFSGAAFMRGAYHARPRRRGGPRPRSAAPQIQRRTRLV
jgi:hypothetical protein